MNDKREMQLSEIIDDEKGFERFKTGPWDPEMAALADTVGVLRSARVFEQPSPGFAERGWQHVLEQVKTESSAKKTGRRKAGRRSAWISAAASLLVVAALLSNPWWKNPPTAGAAEIRVTGTGTVTDLGAREALFPRYAGSMERVSYGIGDGIVTRDTVSGSETRWLPEFEYARDAAWSQDGKRVAFAGYLSAKSAPASPGIWVADADGSAPRQVAVPPGRDTAFESPAWSPDGRKIAFTATEASLSDAAGVVYKHSVMVMDADGSHLTRLAEGAQPAWSGSGTLLAYTVQGADGAPEIWVSDPQGNNARKIADGESPAWSPGHPLIVFSKQRTEHRELGGSFTADVTYRELWAVNEESGTEVRLTEGGFPQRQVDALLAEARAAGQTQARFAVSGEADDEFPSWSPDGTRILFTRNTLAEQALHFKLQELYIAYR